MKTHSILIFLFLYSLRLTAQEIKTNESIQTVMQGIVTDENANPLADVTVVAGNNQSGAISDREGKFIIQLPAGKRVVSFSYVGFKTLKEVVDTEKVSGMFKIVLVSDNTNLQTVEIIGRRENSYKSSMTFAGARTETHLMDIPQSIGYVTKETMEDQQAFRQIDVIKNISGVNAFSTYSNDIVLRGFRASTYLINGLKSVSSGWSSAVLPYVEKMEVIKGPASALFGNSDPGGTVNVITKKPLRENRKSINFSTGSFNTYRLAGDFTGSMDTSGKFLYRLNLAYQNAGSFRDLQGGEDIVIAPTFSFIPTENTRVNFELVYTRTNTRLDRGQPIFGATATSNSSLLYSTPVSFAIGKDNDFLHDTNLFSTISIQQKISDKFSLNAFYMKSLYKENLLEHRTSNRYAVDAAGTTIPTLMEMRTIRRDANNHTDNFSVYGVYALETGQLTQKILLGYDYMQNLTPKSGNSAFNAGGYRNAANNGSISRYTAANKDRYLIVDNMPVPNVPHFDLANPDYSMSEISEYFSVSETNENTPSKYYVNGFYIQDQIKWKQFQLLLGLRKEYYTDVVSMGQADEQKVEQSALIPRAGFVYALRDDVSIYGTFAKGYQPQGSAIIGNSSVYGGPFDPLTSKIFEFGVKTELFRQRLMLTMAAYQIEQNNILMNAGNPDNPDMLRQIGQQQSKGIEMDAAGSITSSLSIIANFSLSEATITESENEAEIGTLMPNAPQSQGNIWIKYKVAEGKLKGIGLALGGNYVGKRNTQNATLQLPSYVLATAAVSYTVDKFRIAANFNNIFNKTHWVGGYDYVRLFPGAPRNTMVSIGYTF
ncbi:TonB-dependent siderophore receptor [Dyadobacter psychrotolerans]|uniref:TonB-dependent receptor n=1 Tax=Dyadobacter psychrotolerans TaxID=2541721 RepID=A0A4R5E1Q5_9BACT|nr:TonB-dependent siderophore receptor [Dyadobacter psychrotolerans]TDE18005.1 TonB-dependent receptor [Dyadobacter psychrotolerans]